MATVRYFIDGFFCVTTFYDRDRLKDLAKDNWSSTAGVWHAIYQFGLPYSQGTIDDDR